MFASCLVPISATVNRLAEEEEELDGKFHVVDVTMLDDICCLDAPVANNDGDSEFLVSSVDGAPPSDIAGEITTVGTKVGVSDA